MNFFNPDNWLWRGFGRVADFFILSILWLVCSIPVVTLGTASLALYDTVAHCFRYNEGGMVGRFFGTFKRELRRGILLTVVWAVVGYLFNVSYQIVTQLGDGSSFWTVLSLVYFVILTIPVGMACWAIGLQSRFTYGFGQLHKTALYFTFRHLPTTVVVAGLGLVGYWICVNMPFFLMILPGVCAYIQSIFVERVFAKYLPAQEET